MAVSRESSLGHLVDSDETMKSMLKSLVDPSGLKALSSKTSQRLTNMEDRVTEALRAYNAVPRGYFDRAADHERNMAAHASLLDMHSAGVAQLREEMDKCLVMMERFEEHSSMLQVCIQQGKDVETKQDEQGALLDTIKEELWGSAALVPSLHSFKSDHAALEEDVRSMRNRLEEQGSSIDDIREGDFWKRRSEEHLQLLTERIRQEALAATLELWSVPEEADKGARQHIERVLSVVDKELVKVLRTNLEKAVARMQSFASQAEEFQEELGQKMKDVEHRVEGVAASQRKTETKLQSDIDLRVKRTEFALFDQRSANETLTLKAEIETLTQRCTTKLADFITHFAKVQEMLGDHEHCLVHHAEELENRPTKYDLLVCQDFMETCVGKDEFDREVKELKSLTSWQTGKIEAFELAASAMKRGGSSRKVPRGGMSGMMSIAGSAQASRRGTLSNVAQSRSVAVTPEVSRPPSKFGSDGPSEMEDQAQMRKDGSMRKEGSMRPQTAAEEAGGSIVPFNTEATDHDDHDADSEPQHGIDPLSLLRSLELQGGPHSEDSDDGNVNDPLTKTQLEALACALVVLSHLVLLEPKLGQSRQSRLERERDFLGQMSDLRHWITHRQLPHGWNPDSLVTNALKAANGFETDLPVKALPRTQPQNHSVVRPATRSAPCSEERKQFGSPVVGSSAEFGSETLDVQGSSMDGADPRVGSEKELWKPHGPLVVASLSHGGGFGPVAPGTAPARIGPRTTGWRKGSPRTPRKIAGLASAREAKSDSKAYALPALRVV